MSSLRVRDLGDSTHSGPEGHGHVRVRCHSGDGLADSLQGYGTLFQARPFLEDPNRVRDALLSLNHSKSYLCGSDFKIGQAHKHLHLTKYIYNEGIQAFSK